MTTVHNLATCSLDDGLLERCRRPSMADGVGTWPERVARDIETLLR